MVLTKGGEMNGYAPLVGMVILGAVFVLATIAVNVLLAVKQPNRAKDDHPHEGSVSVHLTTLSHHHSFRPYDSHLTPWYFGLPNFRLGGT